MTLLVHILQYQLHLSEISDTDYQSNYMHRDPGYVYLCSEYSRPLHICTSVKRTLGLSEMRA